MMKIDLLHNKIVADTITPAFQKSVEESLLPLLSEMYSDGEILGIQMYEDYIADNFAREGYWYYPLTVVTRSGFDTVWVKWALGDGDFKNGLPYSYVGEGNIEFILADDTPDDIAHALLGRSLYCEDGLIKVGVKSSADAADLSGRYSQTFLDELARQITPAIESATSIEGLADSPIELVFSFAAASYMDHISDNVTYRRLTMIDGASAPRDFWVKWTRLDGAVAYSVADHVWGDNILFELGEDVSHKVLEKEYRYLLGGAGEKYHSAMSRTGITSWRDLIKRAVKYGEVTKIEQEIFLAPETLALEDQLAAALGRRPMTSTVSEPVIKEIHADEDEFARAMQKAREVAEGISDYESVPEPEWDEPAAEEQSEILSETVELLEYEVISDEPVAEEQSELTEDGEAEESEDEKIDEILNEIFGSKQEIEPDEPSAIDEEKAELDELTRQALELAKAQKESEEADPLGEMVFEIVAEEPIEPEIEEVEAPVEEAEPVVEEIEEPAPVIDEESIRAEIEAKIRLEYENRARIKAEEELIALRREQEKLRLENEALVARAEREKEAMRQEYEKLREQSRREALAREARDAVRRAEEEKLRAQIENQLRHEARERERLAEAARMAIEEQRRLEAEAARAAYLREEEERARAAEELRLAEEARIEALKQSELEKVRRAEEERQRAIREAMPEMGDGRYTYTTRNVRLIFRRSVDPNITTRIHEIMKAAMEYYGKERMYIKVRASVPDSQTVCLEFIHIPIEEMDLLGNIIKILGNSGLGIAKAIVE